jgi:hypothetical protein
LRILAGKQELKFVVGGPRETHYTKDGKNVADVYNKARFPELHAKPGFERCVPSLPSPPCTSEFTVLIRLFFCCIVRPVQMGFVWWNDQGSCGNGGAFVGSEGGDPCQGAVASNVMTLQLDITLRSISLTRKGTAFHDADERVGDDRNSRREPFLAHLSLFLTTTRYHVAL